MSEFDLIHQYLKPLAGEGAFNLEDDVALMTPSEGKSCVISKDILAANKHFFAHDPPDQLARKAIRVNVSDIIAKGAEPIGYSLGLALPDCMNDKESWLRDFTKGLSQDQAMFGLSLLGGDSIASEHDLMISVTIYGECDGHQLVRRSGAETGDVICVTNTLGDARLALELIQSQKQEMKQFNELIGAFYQPRLPFGVQSILRQYANASIDISDGIFGDIRHIMMASNKGAILDVATFPFSTQAQKLIETYPDLYTKALCGGDDYQVLMTMPERNFKIAQSACMNLGISITEIGQITEIAHDQVTETTHNIAGYTGCPINLEIIGIDEDIRQELQGFSHF